MLSYPFWKSHSPFCALFYIAPVLVCEYTYVYRQEHNVWDDGMFISPSFFAVFYQRYITRRQRVWLWACPHAKKNCSLTTSKLLWIWMSPLFLGSVLLPLQNTRFSSCFLWSYINEVLFSLSFCSFVCDVSCIQLYFISMTRYTEVLLKCKRDGLLGLLRYLLQGDNISPHRVSHSV